MGGQPLLHEVTPEDLPVRVLSVTVPGLLGLTAAVAYRLGGNQCQLQSSSLKPKERSTASNITLSSSTLCCVHLLRGQAALLEANGLCFWGRPKRDLSLL